MVRYIFWILHFGVIFSVPSYLQAQRKTSSYFNNNTTECEFDNPNFNDSLYTHDEFVELLTDPCRYDSSIRAESDQPVDVQLQLDISHMETTDNVRFRAYMLIQYEFIDTRLNYSSKSKRGSIIGEFTLRKHIFIPHLIIKNEKVTQVLGYDGQDVFVKIQPNGTVFFTSRIVVEFYCWMHLAKFPFDLQVCDITWDSWKYGIKDMKLNWGKGGIKLARDFHLTEFQLTDYALKNDTVIHTFLNGPLEGEFSQLVLEFTLTREVGFYIMDYFLPSILLVCTSWVSFWLQADAGPPRATIGTSTTLAFITLNGGLTKDLPKVSYIKATDIWFSVCFCFIFGSLCEFAFVNVIWRRRKLVELRKRNPKHMMISAITPSTARQQASHKRKLTMFGDSDSSLNVNCSQTELAEQNKGSTTSIPMPPDGSNSTNPEANGYHTLEPTEVAIWVDRKSRIFFPLTFLIFNIFYWSLVYTL